MLGLRPKKNNVSVFLVIGQLQNHCGDAFFNFLFDNLFFVCIHGDHNYVMCSTEIRRNWAELRTKK